MKKTCFCELFACSAFDESVFVSVDVEWSCCVAVSVAVGDFR